MGRFGRRHPKPKSMFFPERSAAGVDPKSLAAGLLGQGEVLSIEGAGSSWSIGPAALPAPFCDLVVQIQVDGIPPYPATVQQSIPGMKLNQVQTPHAIVAVRVNPDDHADVAIDFHTDPPAGTPG